MRVLVLSHCHPALSAGGGERAAYSLFEHLKARADVEEAIFVARAPEFAIGHSARFGAFRGRPDEILASPPPCDPLTHSTEDYDALSELVAELCQRYAPDVVHLHHYVFWGIEILELFARFKVRVVLTLHEFIAICHREGQMLKTNGKLCATMSPAECAQCFPEFTPGAFFLRQRLMWTMFAFADAFVAPSAFLAKRYVDWGMPARKVHVIENPLSPGVVARARAIAAGGRAGRSAGAAGQTLELVFRNDETAEARKLTLGYFGQLNPYKGVDTLLEALTLLGEPARSRVHLRIHGANLELQKAAFQERFQRLLAAAGEMATLVGPYDNEQVLELMEPCDWICVPSIWWENSPVVIQEALAIGKPLIVSRIGGMIEKGGEGATLVTFDPGNASDLARKLASLPPRGALGQQRPITALVAERVEQIVALYRQAIAAGEPAAAYAAEKAS